MSERRQPLGTTPIGDLLGMAAAIGVDKLCRWIDDLGQADRAGDDE